MSTSSSPSLHSIVLAGMSPARSSHEASYWIDTSGTDLAAPENPVLRIDVPGKTRCQAVTDVVNAGLLETIVAAKAATDKPVDLSAFTASEEAYLKRFLKRSLPPAYVDAVIKYVSRSREEMVEEMGQSLNQRTRQLYQAVNLIKNLIREKRQLESNTLYLEQTRSNLSKIHTSLKGVHHEMLNRNATR